MVFVMTSFHSPFFFPSPSFFVFGGWGGGEWEEGLVVRLYEMNLTWTVVLKPW